MKLIELLETPVADYQTYSDTKDAPTGGVNTWDNHTPPAGGAKISKDPEAFAKRSSSFTDKRDKILATNPKAVQKMKDMFANTDFDFYFYLVNSKEARLHTEVGLVSRDWLSTNMPSIEPLIPNNPDGITVIFTNNKGAEKVALSPWIMAHRIGHAVRNSSESYKDAERTIDRATTQILEDYYNVKKPMKTYDYHNEYARRSESQYRLLKKKFYEAIGTFRSARNQNLRADFEFLNEVFAQWLITKSGIRLNPVPKKIVLSKAWGHDANAAYGRGDEEYANHLVQEMGEELNHIFYNMMGEAIGKIYVM